MGKIKIGMAVAAAFAAVMLCACAPQPVQEQKPVADAAGQARVSAEQIASVDAGAPLPEADKHHAFNVACATCHGVDNPTGAPVSDAACVTCHDWETLAASTADLKDMENRMENPHDSHIGQVSCLLCHANHQDSVYYCLTCHPDSEYQDIVVP